jgi:uncharacterized protein with NAD-binding domain and iron-sulfur cluster
MEGATLSGQQAAQAILAVANRQPALVH